MPAERPFAELHAPDLGATSLPMLIRRDAGEP